MRTFLVLLVSVAWASAAPVPKEVKKDDLGLIEGFWWEARFNNTPAPDLKASRQFSFNRDGTAGIHQTAGAKPIAFKFNLDPTSKPPQFTWQQVGGGGDYIAIYRLEGDMLYIVFTEVKKPLPKEVKPGVGDVYYELKRVK